jgi:hypothetical protein
MLSKEHPSVTVVLALLWFPLTVYALICMWCSVFVWMVVQPQQWAAPVEAIPGCPPVSTIRSRPRLFLSITCFQKNIRGAPSVTVVLSYVIKNSCLIKKIIEIWDIQTIKFVHATFSLLSNLTRWSTLCVVSLNHAHGDVYSIQHYAIKFISDLRQVGGFLRL